jgi:hypothetical protein
LRRSGFRLGSPHVVATLEREGIEKFVASVNEILVGIATKRRSLRAVA